MPRFALASCRHNAGYSQKEAAKLLGISPGTLSKYEQNSTDISVSLLGKMSKLYSVPLDCIFLGNKSDLIRENKKYKENKNERAKEF